MKLLDITRDESTKLKGIAILMILLHNFFHWIPPNFGENEFEFSADRISQYWDTFLDVPQEFINLLFSFWGHYGVQIFIFLSGYGIAKSLIAKKPRFIPFLCKRLAKLYPAFILSILALLLYWSWVNVNDLSSWKTYVLLINKLLFLHNIEPFQAISFNGPWWFYGLIFQLYLLSIPLFNALQRYGWKALACVLALSYTLIYLLYAPLMKHYVYIMANASGHLPEFALGMYLALGKKVFRPSLILPALLVFALGNYYFAFYPLTFIAVAFLLVGACLMFLRQSTLLDRFFLFYGSISMYLFAIHGFLRKPFFCEWAEGIYSSPMERLLLALAFLLLSTGLALVLKRLSQPLERWLLLRLDHLRFMR